MKLIKHFITITRHRHKVMRLCFKVGLYKQGLLHDLSKYTPSEFIPGVKYFQGNRSPQAKERELFGYSAAWLHHKGRNKHHFEYWVDSGANNNFVFVRCLQSILAKWSVTASPPAKYTWAKTITIPSRSNTLITAHTRVA